MNSSDNEPIIFQFKPGFHNLGYHLLIMAGYLAFLVPLGGVLTFLINKSFETIPLVFEMAKVIVKIIPAFMQDRTTLMEIGTGVGLVMAVIFIVSYLWRVLLLYTHTYLFTETRCIIIHKLFSIDRHIVYYNRLNDVNLRQSLIDRVFNTATVTMAELSYNQSTGVGNLVTIKGCTPEEAQWIVEFVSRHTEKPT